MPGTEPQGIGADAQKEPITTQSMRSDGETGVAGEEIPPSEAKTNSMFSSRWAFWISAIGCSIGFGNMWRFPYLVWEFGGLAFFVPYVISLLIIGLPVSLLEFGVGQLSQGGQCRAFGAINKRMAAIGWGVLCLVNILYYPLLQSWSMLFFGYSFKRNLPWVVSDDDRAFCSSQLTELACTVEELCHWRTDTFVCEAFALNKAKWFFERELMAKPEYWEGVQGFNWKILIVEFGTWVITCLATVGGARILGYVNYVLTILPTVLLIVQVGAAGSLPGSIEGVKQYMGRFDAQVLKDSAVWSSAGAQTLFSLGATQGTMVGYAAHNKRDQNFVQDTTVVAMGDTLYAIIAGFAIFSVTGYMSTSSGIPISELELSGRGLAFQTYPVGLGEGLPYPGSNIVCALFFLTLWFLGISTNVGIVEGTCLIIQESKFWKKHPKLKKWHAYVILISFMFLFSFIDALDMGVHVMDCVDNFVATFSYLFLGGAEAIAAGWFSAWDLWQERAGKTAVYTHLVSYIVGGALGAALGFGPRAQVGKIAGPLIGGVIIIVGWIAAYTYTNKVDPRTGETFTCAQRMNNLCMYNIEQLRQYMNEAACKNSCWKVPYAWSILIKYVIPLAMSIMFFESAVNPYYSYKLPQSPGSDAPLYPWWVFLLGNLGPYLVFLGVLLFFFVPSWMDWMIPDDLEEFEYPDKALYRKALEDDVVVAKADEHMHLESTPSVVMSPYSEMLHFTEEGGADAAKTAS